MNENIEKSADLKGRTALRIQRSDWKDYSEHVVFKYVRPFPSFTPNCKEEKNARFYHSKPRCSNYS